eukprot:6509237-Lingulodinium_polyedra.AAC.1
MTAIDVKPAHALQERWRHLTEKLWLDVELNAIWRYLCAFVDNHLDVVIVLVAHERVQQMNLFSRCTNPGTTYSCG